MGAVVEAYTNEDGHLEYAAWGIALKHSLTVTKAYVNEGTLSILNLPKCI